VLFAFAAPGYHTLGLTGADPAVAATPGGIGDSASTDPTGTTDDTVATGETATGSDDETEEASNKEPDLGKYAIFVLVFGALAAAGLLVFLDRAAGRFYDAVNTTVAKLGVVPKAETTSAFSGGIRGSVQGLTTSPTRVTIDGPGVVTVGKPAEFTAKNGEEAISCTWTIARSDGADGADDATACDPETGMKTTATPASVGNYELTATPEDAGVAKNSVKFAVVSAPASTPSLPFLGTGYATILVAIVATTLVTVLGLLDALDKTFLTTFFTLLLGYIFVKANESSNPATTKAGGTPPAETSDEG